MPVTEGQKLVVCVHLKGKMKTPTMTWQEVTLRLGRCVKGKGHVTWRLLIHSVAAIYVMEHVNTHCLLLMYFWTTRHIVPFFHNVDPGLFIKHLYVVYSIFIVKLKSVFKCHKCVLSVYLIFTMKNLFYY